MGPYSDPNDSTGPTSKAAGVGSLEVGRALPLHNAEGEWCAGEQLIFVHVSFSHVSNGVSV